MVFGFLKRKAAPAPQMRKIERDHAVAGRVLPLLIMEHARATRLTLRVDPGGRSIKVTIPPGVPTREVNSFLNRHTDWLEERVAQLPSRAKIRVGGRIPVRGTPCKIVHEPEKRGAAKIRRGENGPELVVHGDRQFLGRRVADFLKAQAKKDIETLVQRHTARVRKRAKSIRYKDTTSRWGSCSADGNLSFSWRIMMAPPVVIDYLVAHEVAHLVELNHSPDFWKLCERLCPRTEEAKDWLRRNGGKLQAIEF
jgi:predicted metal-dependent hydrolase